MSAIVAWNVEAGAALPEQRPDGAVPVASAGSASGDAAVDKPATPDKIVYQLVLPEPNSPLQTWVKLLAQPLSTLISVAAFLISAITLFRQRRQANSAGWNLALQRIGQVYDAAMADENLARILQETTTSTPLNVLTPKQDIWLASLGMALEQVYVASLGLTDDAGGAWLTFIRNQLAKPTIASHFSADSTAAGDYHPEFMSFLIKEEIITPSATKPPSHQHPDTSALARTLTSSKLDVSNPESMRFWRDLYDDPEVTRQMYARPTDEAQFRAFFAGGHSFVVSQNGTPIGGFSLKRESGKTTVGSFGIVVHRDHRHKGYGAAFIVHVEEQAKAMGLLTLRADVYRDNWPSRRLLDRAKYREFVWVEKNLG